MIMEVNQPMFRMRTLSPQPQPRGWHSLYWINCRMT